MQFMLLSLARLVKLPEFKAAGKASSVVIPVPPGSPLVSAGNADEWRRPGAWARPVPSRNQTTETLAAAFAEMTVHRP